ncbi:MAG TPA: hypothetical protein VK737_08195 [Opitutales bacterium]|nr:hypothetical protein [Opitutales bacterium]
MNKEISLFILVNGAFWGVLLAVVELRTKTLAYLRARWLGKVASLESQTVNSPISQLRGHYGAEGAKLFKDEKANLWMFQIDGFAAADIASLPSRLAGSLTLIESISLLGAQPCYYFAEAAISGQPDDWFAKFTQYVFALDRAIWRKSARTFSAFHDHTAVVRLISLRHASNVFHLRIQQPENRRLARIVAGLQARDLALLRENHLFDFQGNHGLITALCLLHYALDLPEAQRAPLARQVAQWMSSREDFFISDDGVPLEISQTYWKLIEKHFLEIQELLNLLGERTAFRKLAKVREFFVQYSIDERVNRFGNSALGHNLRLADAPKHPPDGIVCRVFDTGLFVADFAAQGRVCAQLVLNAQDVRPWAHGQQSQMAMGYFAHDVFWVDSPGRFTSGKTGAKARIDSYFNQSIPVRAGSGYVPGWRFAGVQESPAHAIFDFILNKNGQTLLQRSVKINIDGSFSLTDSAPGGVVEVRYLLCPTAKITHDAGSLTLNVENHQVDFHYTGQPEFVDGLISFQRNVALPTKILCLRGETVELSVAASQSLSGPLQVHVSPGYPYRKREQLSRLCPNSVLQKLSVKKLLLAAALMLGADILFGLWIWITRGQT